MAVIILVLFALLAGACGSDDNTAGGDEPNPAGSTGAKATCASGTITGAGSTFVATIVQQWIKDFATACPGSTVNYQSVGSGAGIQQFTAGTVDFGASDAVTKADEQTAAEAKHGAVLHIPWSAGGIAVEYNLKGVHRPEALARDARGHLRREDHQVGRRRPEGRQQRRQAAVDRHPGRAPLGRLGHDRRLHLVPQGGRRRPSGQSGSGKDVPWPAGQGAKGSDGVTAAVKQTDGAIGYAEVCYPKGAGLGMAKIKNPAAQFVGPERQERGRRARRRPPSPPTSR